MQRHDMTLRAMTSAVVVFTVSCGPQDPVAPAAWTAELQTAGSSPSYFEGAVLLTASNELQDRVEAVQR